VRHDTVDDLRALRSVTAALELLLKEDAGLLVVSIEN
jgi:hypothetical protein